MSKDKAGKKDKWKHLDLFDMMLNQSKVFRDMVEQFQKAWVPNAPSVTVSARRRRHRQPGEEADQGRKSRTGRQAGKKGRREESRRVDETRARCSQAVAAQVA